MRSWTCATWIMVPWLTFISSGWAYGGASDQVIVGLEIQALAGAALTLSANAISFPAADPDTIASIPASGNPVSVRVEADPTGMKDITLDVRANGNLVSGGNTINITNVTWTATGDGFQAGTMNLTNQRAGFWRDNRPILRTGTFSYFLANSWNYAPGTYTATVTYTLTVP
jgi:hypothetical protein